jgi:hypothetical protein
LDKRSTDRGTKNWAYYYSLTCCISSEKYGCGQMKLELHGGGIFEKNKSKMAFKSFKKIGTKNLHIDNYVEGLF